MDGIRLAKGAIATVDQSYVGCLGTAASLGKFLLLEYNPFGFRVQMSL
jgi:hypothetical protein